MTIPPPLRFHANPPIANGVMIATITFLALATALSAATLTNPRRVETAFEFSILGASNAIYTIETSRDLQNWATITTNRQFGELRAISLPSSAREEFYRVREVRALFTGAFGVRESITFNGGGVRVDSFDSRDPYFFTPDGRLDLAKVRDRGDITSTSALTNALDLGNAKVRGMLHVPPGAGVILGLSGSVGSTEWVSSGQLGIEPGHLIEETPRAFVDAELPQGHVYLTPWRIDGTYPLTNGHYTLPQLSGSMLITGRATLYVAGSAEVRGLVIEANASLDLYVGGPTATISGVVNRNVAASAFAYYGLSGNAQVSVQGNAAFVGTIYAPAAYVAIGGGGNDEVDFMGAIVGRNIAINGKLNMHYDESLGAAGPAL